MQNKIVSATDIHFSYAQQTDEVLRGITLQIDEGSFVVIIGRNGSGKSTFAKMINVLLVPTEGELEVCELSAKEEANTIPIRRNVGMVFQNPDNQIVATVVEEDVAFGPENLGVPTPEIRTRVDEALADVDMTQFAQRQPHMLSGGQKQRVAIAGALAMKPRILVLDEATAMLDPAGRREVSETVRRIRREYKMTVLWITHHMDEAAYADRVIVIDEGKVVMDGTPKKIFNEIEKLDALGLAASDQARLSILLQKEGMGVDTCLTAHELAEQIAEELRGKS
jgi:energy-coupling factor transport system ATP-binding protein